MVESPRLEFHKRTRFSYVVLNVRVFFIVFFVYLWMQRQPFVLGNVTLNYMHRHGLTRAHSTIARRHYGNWSYYRGHKVKLLT